jgi:hypothetical protein
MMEVFITAFSTYFSRYKLREYMPTNWKAIIKHAELAQVPPPQKIPVCVRGCLLFHECEAEKFQQVGIAASAIKNALQCPICEVPRVQHNPPQHLRPTKASNALNKQPTKRQKVAVNTKVDDDDSHDTDTDEEGERELAMNGDEAYVPDKVARREEKRKEKEDVAAEISLVVQEAASPTTTRGEAESEKATRQLRRVKAGRVNIHYTAPEVYYDEIAKSAFESKRVMWALSEYFKNEEAMKRRHDKGENEEYSEFFWQSLTLHRLVQDGHIPKDYIEKYEEKYSKNPIVFVAMAPDEFEIASSMGQWSHRKTLPYTFLNIGTDPKDGPPDIYFLGCRPYISKQGEGRQYCKDGDDDLVIRGRGARSKKKTPRHFLPTRIFLRLIVYDLKRMQQKGKRMFLLQCRCDSQGFKDTVDSPSPLSKKHFCICCCAVGITLKKGPPKEALAAAPVAAAPASAGVVAMEDEGEENKQDESEGNDGESESDQDKDEGEGGENGADGEGAAGSDDDPNIGRLHIDSEEDRERKLRVEYENIQKRSNSTSTVVRHYAQVNIASEDSEGRQAFLKAFENNPDILKIAKEPEAKELTYQDCKDSVARYESSKTTSKTTGEFKALSKFFFAFVFVLFIYIYIYIYIYNPE